jgi:hypothetical protein
MNPQPTGLEKLIDTPAAQGFKNAVLSRCGANDGECPCGLIWIDHEIATKLWTAKDFSDEGGEDEGLTEQGAIRLSDEIVRRWNAQATFWSRLCNLFS